MSEKAICDEPSSESEKPAEVNDSDTLKFPPFPDPGDNDFDEDVSEEEKKFYINKFPDLNAVKNHRLHCTACDRHLGCAPRSESRMRVHPMLRTLVCNSCHTFYNSGEFDKGEDGSELYCRWCGQGGQVYCCSDCPHVFCAKCIKRNFGMLKIKEIENTDDWKCFKCNPNCLWDIRALCWALLRYCDLKNKLTFETQDQKLKEEYQKACGMDDSECCRHKANRKRKEPEKEVKKKEPDSAKKVANAMVKIPPTIQVKKFASIHSDEQKEKKAPKRSASPKHKPVFVRSPITVPQRLINPAAIPSMPKKMRMPNMSMATAIRFQPRGSVNTYPRLRPKPPMQMAILNNFNGFSNPNIMNSMVVNDNINLSLESLTQGLDMSAVVGMSNCPDDDVVCTPDFPLEPLCEVTEENNDDDVECITPSPAAPPTFSNTPPPLVPRFTPTITDLSPDNIIQMTENDVTVNAATGGLKFRVDPQTLSSNKMYRLPDGRIFAINTNPNMPGGYSATIVAVTETNSSTQPTKPAAPKGSMYSAKLSAITSPQTPVQTLSRQNRNQATRVSNNKTNKQVNQKSKTTESASSRQVDLNVPIEWYRYNLIDAVDSLQYSLSRLQKLKKEATSMFLRTRRVDEIRNLHKTLDRLLNTSCTRFREIRNSLNKEFRQFLTKKIDAGNVSENDDDDDDVEILNDPNENDDPIFIDENSMESVCVNESNSNTTHEVDLTGGASSENNNSSDKLSESFDKDPLIDDIGQSVNENTTTSILTESIEDSTLNNTTNASELNDNFLENIHTKSEHMDNSNLQSNKEKLNGDLKEIDTTEDILKEPLNKDSLADKESDKLTENDIDDNNKINDSEDQIKIESDKNKVQDEFGGDKTQETEMTEELIENLLKDENDDTQNLKSIDISEEFQES